MKSLLNQIVRGVKEVGYEISYQTGIGWKYEEGDSRKDGISRMIQRYAPNISPSNLLVRIEITTQTLGFYAPRWLKDNKINLN
mgnify:CR=1 FL=1